MATPTAPPAPQSPTAHNAPAHPHPHAPPSQPQQPSSTTAPTTTTTGSTSGTFTVLLFAAASTHANDTDSLTLPAPMTVSALFDELERRFPGMKRAVLSSAAVTRNLEYLELEVDEWGELVSGEGDVDGEGGGEVRLLAGDEVAVVPPVSSG